MLSKLSGKSGEVEFNAVLDESVDMQNKITMHAVEDGVDVADHVQLQPESIPLSGVVVGGDADKKLAKLRKFHRNGEFLTLLGRNIFDNLVIENFTTRHNPNIRNGFEFSITLKRVRVATIQEVEIAVPANSVSKTQTKPKQSKGKQQPKKKEPAQTKNKKKEGN